MKRVTIAVVLAALIVPAAASARTYLVPPHARSQLGTLVREPRSVDVGLRYGDDAYVQDTMWTRWGSKNRVRPRRDSRHDGHGCGDRSRDAHCLRPEAVSPVQASR